MIKRLRRKTIMVNMTIFTVMLIFIMFTVLRLTQRNFDRDLESLAQGIEEGYLWTEASEETTLPADQGITEMPAAPVSPAPSGISDFAPEAKDIASSLILVDDGNGGLEVYGNSTYAQADSDTLRTIFELAEASESGSGTISSMSMRFSRIRSRDVNGYIFIDVSTQEGIMRHLITDCIVIGLGAWAAFFVICMILAKWTVRPVEQAWKQQKEFVADASHSLKTPLTIILTNAEFLQSGSYSEKEEKQFADNITTVSHQMRDLIEKLLTLAKADRGLEKAARKKLNFGELIEDVLLSFDAVCFEQGLTVDDSTIADNIMINADEGGMREVVNVLMDNAQKYAAKGTAIRVSLVSDGSRYCLFSVSNEGPEIKQEDMKNIFERFHRGSAYAGKAGGYGLGLPIAKEIVSSHRGRIWAESAGGTTAFHVRLRVQH